MNIIKFLIEHLYIFRSIFYFITIGSLLYQIIYITKIIINSISKLITKFSSNEKITNVLQEKQAVYSSLLLSLYRNNEEKICGFVFTPILDSKNIYNISSVIEAFNQAESFICISSDKYTYTRELIKYIKLYADKTDKKLKIYMYDVKGIDSLFLFDLSYYNSHFVRIKDVPIGFYQAKKASMTCKYECLQEIIFFNLNLFLEDSVEIIFSNSNIDFGVSYEELIQHIDYEVLENKEIYLFYYHIVISLYINQNIINKANS